MNIRTIILIFILRIFSSIESEAQKKFSVIFEFSQNIDTKSLDFCYDDGITNFQSIKPKIEGFRVTLNATFFSKYATIMVHYPTDSSTKHYYSSFWVGEKPATILINEIDESLHSPLKSRALENAFEVKNMGEEKVDKFISEENKNYDIFYNQHRKDTKNNDSLSFLLHSKHEILTRKKIDYISNNPSDYFALWYFKNEIANSHSISNDTLIKIFKNIFPNMLKDFFEKGQILKAIQTKPILKNTIAPNFDAKDIKGNKISLGNLRKKCVMIIFWASWCVPCVEEIPEIKKIRNKFTNTQLEIISVTKDDVFPPFEKAILKYAMNWTHIYGNQEVADMYRVGTIPHIYIIDKNGYIKYSKIGRSDEDAKIINEILTKLIQN